MPLGIPASCFRAVEPKPITVDAEMRQLEVALSHDQWEAVPGRELLWARVVELLHANPDRPGYPTLRSILVVPAEFDLPGPVFQAQAGQKSSSRPGGRARLTSPFCPADTALRADIRRLSRGELVVLVSAPPAPFAEDVVRRALAFEECPWLKDISHGALEAALSKLSGDEAGIVFGRLCNTLEPRLAVAFSSASRELWAPTQAQRQQLKTEHEAAAALCRKMGMLNTKWERRLQSYCYGNNTSNLFAESCKEMREATVIDWLVGDVHPNGVACVSAADLEMLGKLGSVLPKLQALELTSCVKSPYVGDGVLRLAECLGAGALPAVWCLYLTNTRVGDSGALALAAALGRDALPQLNKLAVQSCGIGDPGLVALAPELRRLQLESIYLQHNSIGDEGLTALVTTPPSASDALPLEHADATASEERFAALADAENQLSILSHQRFGGLIYSGTISEDTQARFQRMGRLLNSLQGSNTQALKQRIDAAESVYNNVHSVFKKLTLQELDLRDTQVSDAGCAALLSALNIGALPQLCTLELDNIPASDAAKAAVEEWEDGGWGVFDWE